MTTASTQQVQSPSALADPTVGFRRRAGAVALPLAFAFQLACNAIYAWASTSSGLSDTGTAEETLRFYGLFPNALVASTVLAAVGVLVMIPGLLTALKVLRPAKPRLALWAVGLMIAGYACYLGIVLTNFDGAALAQVAQSHPDAPLAAVLDTAQSTPYFAPFFVLFVIGNLVGTLLLGLGVMLSGILPRYAGALIMCWTVGHVINIAGGGELFAVAGGALEIAGLTVVAAAAMRTSDAEWAARG